MADDNQSEQNVNTRVNVSVDRVLTSGYYGKELGKPVNDNYYGNTSGMVGCSSSATMNTWLVPMLTGLYVLTVLVGVVGNGIVIWTVLGRRYMRTVTNYFLLNLAISDFLNVTLNVPFVYAYIVNDNTWIFGHFYCKFLTFIGVSVLSTIVLTFMAMALERYVAIIYPLRKRLDRKSTLAVMLIVWLLSFALAMPAEYYAKEVIRDTRKVCIQLWPDINTQFLYDVTLMVINYCLPVCVTCCAYTRVGLVLWRSKQIGESTREQQENTNTKRKVVKMFVTVVVTFTLCWLPFHSYFVLSHTHPSINCLPYSSTLYTLIFWMAMANSACNPIIYFACNKRFRYNLIFVFRWCPFVKFTKFQETIVRDGVTSMATCKGGTSMLMTPSRQSHQNSNSHTYAADMLRRSPAANNHQQNSALVHACIRKMNAHIDRTELVSYEDNESHVV